jgi:D-lactate dehydrogenase
MKVAVFSTHSYDRDFFKKYNISTNIELTYFDAPLNKDTANLSIDFEAVCVFVNDKVDEETAKKLSKNGVKLIVLRCAGFNNIDLEATKKYHLIVLRVPAYSPSAIAEHAVALILTLNRKTHKAYNRVRENNFSVENLTGFNLEGKTVGVVGTGRIGAVFCRIMLGFGCHVIAYDTLKSDAVIKMGVEYKTLNELWNNSDIISLHCPLTPETHHLINQDAFEKMNHGVMLINTSRGAVIHTKDAISALKNGKLGYLGIDVYEQEENLFFRDLSESIVQDDLIARLMSFPNVLITAHQGFFTNEALEQITTITLKNIEDFEKGNFLENEVKAI